MSCKTCIWWSDGINEAKGSGWCYSSEEYTDPDYDCSFWQKGLRAAMVNAAPLKELEHCGTCPIWQASMEPAPLTTPFPAEEKVK